MPNTSRDLEDHRAEAWGDAPIHTPHEGLRTDSEISFPFQIWSFSTTGSCASRKTEEIRFKRDIDIRSAPAGFPNHPHLTYFSHNSFRESIIRPSAYFSPHPPSFPLYLQPRISLDPPYEDITIVNECGQTNLDGVFERRNDSFLVVRNLVDNILDRVVDIASESALRKPHINKSAATVVPLLSKETCSVSRATSPVRFRNLLPMDTRNIAVQAKTNNIEHNVKLKSEHPPGEWSGGVRALRDSHVRLVLRQLKHIERLNRALDRHS